MFRNSILLLLLTAGVLMASPVDIMMGSRGFGMGGAYVAVVNDPSAAYWNPAGLSHVQTISIMESHWLFQDIEGLNVNYISAAIPIKYVGTVSGSWLLTHATLEEGWDDTKNEPLTKNSGDESQFSLSLGRQLWEELLFFKKTAIGLSLNRYALTFSDNNDGDGAGLGFDLGVQTGLPAGFSLGFMARYLGTEIMGIKIDPELRWGVGYSVLLKEMHRITVDFDGSLKHNRDYEDIIELEQARRNYRAFGGLEYGLVLDKVEISLRGGMNTPLYNSVDNHAFGAGVGVKYNNHAIQYAFGGNTRRDISLGYSHRVTLVLALGDLIKK